MARVIQLGYASRAAVAQPQVVFMHGTGQSRAAPMHGNRGDLIAVDDADIHRSDRIMKSALLAAAIAIAAVAVAPPANAKGCIKGAIVGGVAGHYAGHHGVLGAAAGCLYGRHHAKEQQRQQQTQDRQGSGKL